MWIAIAILLAILWRRPQLLLLVATADVLADLIAYGLKLAIGQPRPRDSQPLVSLPKDPSFPSGHAATAFACATILAFAVPVLAPAWFLVAVAIAYSRVYVGVHYPFDVIAGAALGAVVATALLLLVRGRPGSRPPLPAG